MEGDSQVEWRRSVTAKIAPTNYLHLGERVMMLGLAAGKGMSAAVCLGIAPSSRTVRHLGCGNGDTDTVKTGCC